ncbi:MAG: hypothetical protein JW874_00720, partial [Spirochaetales bacterium]|nr:hypothetical protein [Spirochaetales bacterium]
ERHSEKVFNDLNIENHLWKRLGDETVIALLPKNMDDLYKLYYGSLEIVKHFNKPTVSVNFQGKFRLFCAGYHYSDSILIIDQKGTRSDYKEYKGFVACDYTSYRFSNLLVSAKPNKKRKINEDYVGDVKQYDFIGPDMDIGFRISSYTDHGKFVVSDKVAYIYESTIGKHGIAFKIYDGEVLKGVWKGHKYPKIYMYAKEQTSIRTSIKSVLDQIYTKSGALDVMKRFLSRTKTILGESAKKVIIKPKWNNWIKNLQ